jgi:hypothetical protein
MENQRRYVFNFFKVSQQEMQEKIQGLAKEIAKMMLEANGKAMAVLFQECKSIRYSAQAYLEESKIPQLEKETLINVGYTNAMLDMMQMYLEGMNTRSEIQHVHTKYRDKILSVLVKRGTMLHGDLASALEVSASGLTAIIKKMNETSVQLIHVEEVSKFKLYSATPAAYSYIVKNNPELRIEVEHESNRDSKQMERLLAYAVELSRIQNEAKIKETGTEILNYSNKTRCIDRQHINNKNSEKLPYSYKYKSA